MAALDGFGWGEVDLQEGGGALEGQPLVGDPGCLGEVVVGVKVDVVVDVDLEGEESFL